MTPNRHHLLAPLALAIALAGSANAAVITNPTLGSVIDPTGGEDVSSAVDESHGTPQATLEARSDLRVLNSFAGFAGGATNGVQSTVTNYVSFTDSTLPDIRFSIVTDDANTGAASTTSNLISSTGSSAIHFDNDFNVEPILTISFGTWNGSSFAADRTVDAAGFLLTQVIDDARRRFDVTFKDSGGLTIASFANLGGNTTSTLDDSIPAGSGTTWPDFYIGWDATAESTNQIAEIVIALKDGASSGNTASSGFAELAFTTIPEPSSALLGGLGMLLLLHRRRN